LDIRTTETYEKLARWVADEVNALKNDEYYKNAVTRLDAALARDLGILDAARVAYFDKIDSKLNEVNSVILGFSSELDRKLKNLPRVSDHDLTHELPSDGLVSYSQLLEILDNRLPKKASVSMSVNISPETYGMDVDIDLTTNGIEDGFVYYWCISSDTVDGTDNDITSGQLKVINGKAAVATVLSKHVLDKLPAGFYVKLRKYSIDGMVVETSRWFDSAMLVSTYAVSGLPSSITNRTRLSLTVNTTRVKDNSKYTWMLGMLDLDSTVFSTTTGTFEVNGNRSVINFSVLGSGSADVSGRFYFIILDANGEVCYTSGAVSVNIPRVVSGDTGVNPTYVLDGRRLPVNGSELYARESNLYGYVTDIMSGRFGATKAVAVDRTAPVAALSIASNSLMPDTLTTVTITFSEAVNDLTLDDFTVVNGSISNLRGSGSNYTMDLLANGTSGPGYVKLNSGVVRDPSGNADTLSSIVHYYVTERPFLNPYYVLGGDRPPANPDEMVAFYYDTYGYIADKLGVITRKTTATPAAAPATTKSTQTTTKPAPVAFTNPLYLMGGARLPTSPAEMYAYQNNLYGYVADNMGVASSKPAPATKPAPVAFTNPLYLMGGARLPTSPAEMYAFRNNQYGYVADNMRVNSGKPAPTPQRYLYPSYLFLADRPPVTAEELMACHDNMYGYVTDIMPSK
jgi:hypothetical protein